jgi:hypothetical protein
LHLGPFRTSTRRGGWRLHGQVGRLLAPEDAIDVAGRAAELVEVIEAVGDQVWRRKIYAALPKMANAAKSDALRAALNKHKGETEAK